MEPRKSFLIMEKQDNVRELLSFYIESKFNFTPLKCTNISGATKLLLKNPDIALILCGTGEVADDYFSLVNYYRERCDHKKTILYDIEIFRKKITSQESSNEDNPHKYDGVKELVSIVENFFEIIPDNTPKEFSPVSMDAIPYLNGIDFDLYLKMPSNRFIKLFREGDKVELSDIRKYQGKGVYHLYVNQNCYSWVIKNIERDIVEVSQNPSRVISNDNQEDQLSRSFDSLLDEMNVDKETYDEIMGNVNDVKSSISKNLNLKGFLNNTVIDRKMELFIENRIKLISMISCGIAKELCWGSAESYRKLVLAAHLHDMVLMKNPALAMIKTEESFKRVEHMFSKEDRELFTNHPEMTAKLLSADPSIPSDVISIIEQHHELSDGTGFPNKIANKRLRPFSCLFIVSLDLATYILNNKDWKMGTFIHNARDNYKGPTFIKIVRQLTNFKGIRG